METIQAAPNGVSKSGIPSGCILMWFGSTATIPNGWHLCDGSNGTPDLRNRFIVGAGSGYSPGNSGGQESVALTVKQMPQHSHTISGGDHSHSITGSQHSHGFSGSVSITIPISSQYGANSKPDYLVGYPAGSSQKSFSGSVSGTTESASPSLSCASTTPSMSVENTGNGNAHENRPPTTHCALS